MMFLIQDHFQTDTFLAWTSAIVSAIYIAIVATRFDRGGLQRYRMGCHDKVGHVPWSRYATVCLGA